MFSLTYEHCISYIRNFKVCRNYKSIRKKILPKDKLNLSILQKTKIINKKYKKFKLLGSGDLKEKFDIEVNYISNSAKQKIEKLGGKVTLIK